MSDLSTPAPETSAAPIVEVTSSTPENLTPAQGDAYSRDLLRQNILDLEAGQKPDGSQGVSTTPSASDAASPQANPNTPDSSQPNFSLESLDPTTRAFVDEVGGGDISKAIAYAAAIAKSGQTPVAESSPAAEAPAQAPAQQYLPPTPQPEVVENTVKDWLTKDHEVQQWANQITQHVQQFEQARQAIPQLEQQLALENLRLTIPEVIGDAYAFQQTQAKVLQLQQQVLIAKQQAYYTDSQIRDLRRQYLDKSNYFRDHYSNEYSKLVNQQQQTLQTQQAQTQWVNQMTAIWPVALQRVAARHAIPDALMSDLEQRVQGASFRLPPGQYITPANLETFMEQQAVALKQVLDTHHRIQSGQYAKQAAARTQSMTSAPNASTNGNPQPMAQSQPDNRSMSPEAVDRQHRDLLRQNMMDAFGRR